MSLFKLRDFWTSGQLVNAELQTQEEFDCSSLTMNALNTENDFILCGSHMGILRIFKPSCEIIDSSLSPYHPSDLYVEKNINSPILQIECGRLVSGSALLQIAILHPRNFAVYSFTMKQGSTEQGNQNLVNLLYEHKLRRSAANFSIGPFGNTQNRDFIAVQSLDGMLSFFEQETFVFACFLPDFLLPGCFVYARRSDCFIITGTSLAIESFTYKNLSANGQNSNENDAGGLRCQSEWSMNVSEHILDVQYLYDGFSKESWLVCLGERNLYCLSDMGKARFMKRLDFNPMTMTSYLMNDNIMTCIVSETSTMLILENASLKWSAQLAELPVAIARANLRNMRGVFVTLTETGNVQCSYLGTEPNLFQAPPLQNLELDYEAAEKELIDLNRVIKSSQGDLKGVVCKKYLNISTELKSLNAEWIIETTLVPQEVLQEVNVTINVDEPCSALPHFFFLEGSALQDKITLSSIINCSKGSVLKSLDVEVIATCIPTIGMPKVYKSFIKLPSQIAVTPTTPTKENLIKLVISVNETAPNLFELFADLCDPSTPNMMALDLNSNQSVTFLLAKSSSRYRIQSDSLSALNFALKDFSQRLQKHFESNRSFQLTFTGSLPLKELSRDLNEHYVITKDIERLQLELIELGGQFRLIQKRLIAKFKDRHPTPLNKLSMLMQDTYSEILKVTDAMHQLRTDLKHSQMKLGNSLSTVAQLIQLGNCHIDQSLVENYLNADVEDIDGLYWEDVMNANTAVLLRTFLAKSEKDKLRGAQESYERVGDFVKFEKHVLLAIDRLLKKDSKMEKEQMPDCSDVEENADEKRDILLPIGSNFGESSTRILSARLRKPFAKMAAKADLIADMNDSQSQLCTNLEEDLSSSFAQSD